MLACDSVNCVSGINIRRVFIEGDTYQHNSGTYKEALDTYGTITTSGEYGTNYYKHQEHGSLVGTIQMLMTTQQLNQAILTIILSENNGIHMAFSELKARSIHLSPMLHLITTILLSLTQTL